MIAPWRMRVGLVGLGVAAGMIVDRYPGTAVLLMVLGGCAATWNRLWKAP